MIDTVTPAVVAETNGRTGFEFEAHPLAATLPMARPEEFASLKLDIARHGILQKIVLFAFNADGTAGAVRILDGRNRYKAALAVGHVFTEANFEYFHGCHQRLEFDRNPPV